MATNRNRRLRKKLHLGEFTEYGFEVGFGALDQDSGMQLLARLSDEVLIPSGMSFFYLGDGQIFVSSLDSSLSVNEREHVNNWAKQQSDLTSFEIGSLVDAWHPPRGVRCYSSGRKTTIYEIGPGGKTK